MDIKNMISELSKQLPILDNEIEALNKKQKKQHITLSKLPIKNTLDEETFKIVKSRSYILIQLPALGSARSHLKHAISRLEQAMTFY